MAKSPHRSDLPSAPHPRSPDDIRNVVLVGPGGAGKTALYEAVLTARVPGHHPRGSDHERTAALTVASFETDGTTLNLLDTPGFPDFVGELRAGLRAADAALFVVSGADEIDRPVSLLWRECAAVRMPRAVVVTHLDQPRADFATTVEAVRRAFGDARATHWPVVVDGEVTGVVGLLTGGDAAPPDARTALVESVIEESEDDDLLERYLAGEELEVATLMADLRAAVERGTFFPILPVSPPNGVGVEELLALVEQAFPSPTVHPLPMVTSPAGAPVKGVACDPSAPLVAEVVQTTSDPYVGRLSLVRVFSGTLRVDETVHVSGHLGDFVGHDVPGHPSHDDDERIGPLSAPFGESHRARGTAIAGELALVSKLAHAETSDTLSSLERPAVVAPWLLPEPQLPVAVVAATPSDEDKLGVALQRLVAEDVTLRMEVSAETGQVVLWTMGQAHVDAVIGQLADRWGVTVTSEPYRTALRETFVRRCTSQGRHVKQSGGHGQYAVCTLEIEPLPRGAGVEFVDRVSGGSVPRQFVPSVEKGVRAQLERGLLTDHPVVDVRVTLTDGKAHSVDSSDLAFQSAAGLALREAANVSTVALLEPVDAVEVTVADDYLGAVMADLRGRRGHVVGTEPGDDQGWTLIRSEVPASELSRYPIDLRSVSHGTGSFTRSALRHDLLPADRVTALLPG
ncbi:MAG: elongation factor G-like protein EF-G2 [Terracoccus sp.]